MSIARVNSALRSFGYEIAFEDSTANGRRGTRRIYHSWYAHMEAFVVHDDAQPRPKLHIETTNWPPFGKPQSSVSCSSPSEGSMSTAWQPSSRSNQSTTWSKTFYESPREAIARVHFRFPLTDLDISDSGEISRDSSGPITPPHHSSPLVDEDVAMSAGLSSGMRKSVEDVAYWVKGVASVTYDSEESSCVSVTDEEGVDWGHIEEGILKMVDEDVVEVLRVTVLRDSVAEVGQRKSSVDMLTVEDEKPVPEDFNASARPFDDSFFEDDDDEDNKENISLQRLR